eukprot:1145447-Pelagomonas_calceolata.AAC.6
MFSQGFTPAVTCRGPACIPSKPHLKQQQCIFRVPHQRLLMHKLHPLPPPARGYGEDQRQRDVGEQEENAEQDRIADKRGVVPAAQVLSVHLDEQQSKFLLVQGWPKAITVQNMCQRQPAYTLRV